MAYITMDEEKLLNNYQYLNETFKDNKIYWSIVTKLLCGNEKFLKVVLDTGIEEVCDSRLINLKRIKELRPDVQTVLIKPPSMNNVKDVVRYADVTFNSESETIEKLSQEAVTQNKIHKIVIMIELGDLREGIMGESLINFYDKIFRLPNIEIVAIGTNLNCLHGVMPSNDKLIQLSLYKQIIELKFKKSIRWVSGGTSVVLPLLFRKNVPKAINHFRIGEALFFGLDIFSNETIEGMNDDVLKFYAEIIEITKKPKVPTGMMLENPSGVTHMINEDDYGKESYRAILNVGLLDIAPEFLIPDDEKFQVTNASSDMLIVDLGKNEQNYKVGDYLSFKLRYMGALGLMNSDYIEKKVV